MDNKSHSPTFTLKQLNPQNISVVFTWDDNQVRHITHIAPLFKKYDSRCTFYINSGEKDFKSIYANGYAELVKNGFEIGSHSYSHCDMTKLSGNILKKEFTNAINSTLKLCKTRPITFAFPFHYYNDYLISEARRYYIETRNTLANSKRFSIKTDTTSIEMTNAIDDALLNKYNIVFSGHSLTTNAEFSNKMKGEGYEPIRIGELEIFLRKIVKQRSKFDFLTFSQAAVKEFIKTNATINNVKCTLSSETVKKLLTLGINKQVLNKLL